MLKSNQLLSELLRPQQLGDLTLPQREIDWLQHMVVSGNIMNMTFYGGPGIGKTSAGRAFIAARGQDDLGWIEIPGSSSKGGNHVLRLIEQFASSVSMSGGVKLCFVDEADSLSKAVQGSLRYVIENSHNCRFLFTANDERKLIPAIQSRMMMLCFDISPVDRIEVIRRLRKRCEGVLLEHAITFHRDRLDQIIGIYFPDLRGIANRLQYEFEYA